MKRGLLIGVGTLGSLGAVFAITPPQFGSSNSTGSALGGNNAPSTPAPVATPSTPTPSTSQSSTPAPTKSSTPKASSKPAPKATPKATKSAPATTPTPTTAATQPPQQSNGASGTFTGATFPASEYGRNWGDVHVVVTLKNGKISSINGQQSPASRGYMAFNQIDPYVATEKVTLATIKSTSASALPYVSGATYSSMAYWESLKSALQQAGI